MAAGHGIKTALSTATLQNPKYAAGFDSEGLIGCGSGRPPINYSSHSDNVGLWRKRGAQYAGASGRLLKWRLP